MLELGAKKRGFMFEWSGCECQEVGKRSDRVLIGNERSQNFWFDDGHMRRSGFGDNFYNVSKRGSFHFFDIHHVT